MEGARTRIEAAVESGDMTREEANEMLAQMRRRMDASRERGEGKCPDCKSIEGHDRGESRTINWDGIKARIEAAVENGDMTREEADKKLNALEGRKGKNRGEKSKEHRKGHDTDKNSSDD